LLVALVPVAAIRPGVAAGATPPALLTAAPAGTPVLVPTMTKPPAGYRLRPSYVLALAKRNPTVIAALRGEPNLIPYVYTKGFGIWQVSWFTPPPNQKERIQVYVSDALAQVTQAWTGWQVQWTMARGYPGAFGRRVTALYVWLPLCLAFVLPFLPLRLPRAFDRRPRDGRRRSWIGRPTLLLLDALMLLGFSISLAFFNHGDLGMSVPTVYPFLVYVLARMLLLAAGIGRPTRPQRLFLPAPWLAVGLVFLIGFRIGLNVTNSNVIDVGYAGVVGANRVLYGQDIYGGWPADNLAGDTYGPVNYYAYVPFTVAFGWSGVWDPGFTFHSLPASHAATIAFDLLTLFGLFMLGRMVRGPTLGITLAYCWAAYPFTLFVMNSNSNDSLVAALLVLTLLVMRWPVARGITASLAGFTKFAPLALGPLFLRGAGPPPSPRAMTRYVLAYGVTAALVLAPVVIGDNLKAFWHDTIAYQASRPAPFSVWGLYGGLAVVAQRLVQVAAVALAFLVAFVPRRRGLVEVAALGAAVIIALQLAVTYWFYLYIVWFFPMAIFALLSAEPAAAPRQLERPPELAHARVG
jgi:hypothetical protein